ncbi:MAG TPA: amino acid synthesis family protein [Burkholderiales bacterium]|nr:amino acid synthesis family protein [Burkholderiales bacterium]
MIEHKLEEAGRPGDTPLRKVAACAVIGNPHAGRYVDDLKPLIEASADLGRELAQLAVGAMAGYPAESYGKGAIVGTGGEQEHANALITTTFADPMRKAVGGGKAWISSFTKRAAPGTPIDIPLAYKDALYVRSHYDGMTIMLPDTPQPDEIAVIICLANRGRLNARVGGLARADAKGQDGLS